MPEEQGQGVESTCLHDVGEMTSYGGCFDTVHCGVCSKVFVKSACVPSVLL